MKLYLFSIMRTCFLIQLVLLTVYFISVPAVRADLITFQFEGELTRVDTPLEGQFSVGDSFGGTYTFESNTPMVVTDLSGVITEFDDDVEYYMYKHHYPDAIKALDFSSGSYMAVAESGKIIVEPDGFTTYKAIFTGIEGASVGGHTPHGMDFRADDYYINPNFSSNRIQPEYNMNDYEKWNEPPYTGRMSFSFEEVGSQNFSSLRGEIFSVSLVDRISTIIVPNNKWVQMGLKTAPPAGSTIADIIGDDISAPYNSKWVVYSYETSTNTYKQLSLTDIMLPGIGYWFIQTTGNSVTIDMPEASTDVNIRQSLACSSFKGCFEIPLQSPSSFEPQWQMIGYPFRSYRRIDKIRVVTAGIGSSCFTGCTLAQANEKYLVSEPLYHYDGTSYQQLTTERSSRYFSPWDGAWVATLPSAHRENVTLLIPAKD